MIMKAFNSIADHIISNGLWSNEFDFVNDLMKNAIEDFDIWGRFNSVKQSVEQDLEPYTNQRRQAIATSMVNFEVQKITHPSEYKIKLQDVMKKTMIESFRPLFEKHNLPIDKIVEQVEQFWNKLPIDLQIIADVRAKIINKEFNQAKALLSWLRVMRDWAESWKMLEILQYGIEIAAKEVNDQDVILNLVEGQHYEWNFWFIREEAKNMLNHLLFNSTKVNFIAPLVHRQLLPQEEKELVTSYQTLMVNKVSTFVTKALEEKKLSLTSYNNYKEEAHKQTTQFLKTTFPQVLDIKILAPWETLNSRGEVIQTQQ